MSDKNKLTVKQEKFVNFLFQGFNQRESYVKAGYAINSTLIIMDANASRLANLEKVKARLAELQKKAEDRSVMTVLERKQRLTEIARADLADFVDPGGEITYSKDRANHRAVSEFNISTTYTKKGDPIINKSIKLQNPITAISELNKMDHIYDINNIQINNTQVIFVIGKGYQGRDPEPVEIEGSKDDLTPTNS